MTSNRELYSRSIFIWAIPVSRSNIWNDALLLHGGGVRANIVRDKQRSDDYAALDPNLSAWLGIQAIFLSSEKFTYKCNIFACRTHFLSSSFINSVQLTQNVVNTCSVVECKHSFPMQNGVSFFSLLASAKIILRILRDFSQWNSIFYSSSNCFERIQVRTHGFVCLYEAITVRCYSTGDYKMHRSEWEKNHSKRNEAIRKFTSTDSLMQHTHLQ